MVDSGFSSIKASIAAVSAHLGSHTVIPKSEIKALDAKLQKVFSEVNLIHASGYKLSDEDVSSLKELSKRVQAVLPKGKIIISPAIRKAFQSIQKATLHMRSIESGASTAAKAVTKPAWVGILMKEGREDEAILLLKNILDPKLKNQAKVEMIKAGKVSFVLGELSSMGEKELGHLIEEMSQNAKDPFVKSAICLLPGVINGRQDVNVMDLLEKIEDPKIKMGAYRQFAMDGGMHSIMERAKTLPPELAEKQLLSLRQEFFASNMQPNLLKEFMSGIDIALEEIQEKDRASIKLKDEEQITNTTSEKPSLMDSVAQGVKGFRKKMADLTGLHNFFSGPSKVKDEKFETKTNETSSITSEEVDDELEVSSLPSIEETPLEQVSETKIKLVSIMGDYLFSIMFAMIGKREISDFSSANKRMDIDFRFGIGKVEDKKVPKELVKILLKEFNVPSAVAVMTSVTAKFPEMIDAVRKVDMLGDGSMWIEFPNPKETIAFKVSGIGDLGVKKVKINDRNEVVVTFNQIDKNGWGKRELEANLGEKEELAIPFWEQIWE